MIFGMSIATFTTVHVIISLIGMVSGLVVLFGMVRNSQSAPLSAVFLATTVLTSVTGYPIPPFGLDPARIIGTLSLVLLLLALAGLYLFHLAGPWRWIYVVTATMALYLNCFVGVVQAFQKIPSLKALASGPPFAIAQLVVLAIFIALGFISLRKFHPASAAA